MIKLAGILLGGLVILAAVKLYREAGHIEAEIETEKAGSRASARREQEGQRGTGGTDK